MHIIHYDYDVHQDSANTDN